MTTNVVAARQSTTARDIGARQLLGDFNGLPVIDNNAKVIGIVTAVDIMRAIRQDRNLDSIRAIDIMTRLQKAIVLVPVVDDEHKLIGLVGRLDILRQNLNEKFVTIGKRSGLSEANSPAKPP
jgi:CBS domain-containing protein